MKVYIAGPITDDPDYKKKFHDAAGMLMRAGYYVMNPAVQEEGFTHSEYMTVSAAMQMVCDVSVFLPGWERSAGCAEEIDRCINQNRFLITTHVSKGSVCVSWRVYKGKQLQSWGTGTDITCILTALKSAKDCGADK